jgi:hypothetical protein
MIFIPHERGGACSIKSTLMALRGQFKELKDYKQFKLDLKYDSLCRFYSAFLKDPVVHNEDKQFFMDSCGKFMRSLAKAVTAKMITEEECNVILAMHKEASSKWVVPQVPVGDMHVSGKVIECKKHR